MDLPQELDNYIRESIDHSLGLPASSKTLALKLQASQEALKRLQNQFFFLNDRLKEKDELIEQARAEASTNSQAIKEFIGENQKLGTECANLLTQCSRWEKECTLYERDRDALMEFGNDADERAKEAEIHVLELEDKLKKLTEEVKFYKQECEKYMANERRVSEEFCMLRERINEIECARLQGCSTSHFFDSPQCSILKTENQKEQPKIQKAKPGSKSVVGTNLEGELLDSVVTSFINEDAAAANALAFLEANNGAELYEILLKMFGRMRPSTQNILSLVSEVKKLQEEKENLRSNLHKAEDEVKILFEENVILNEANKKLVRQRRKENHHKESGGKERSSSSAKGNKRKTMIGKISDFNGPDSPRQPLSPLQLNSHDSKSTRSKSSEFENGVTDLGN